MTLLALSLGPASVLGAYGTLLGGGTERAPAPAFEMENDPWHNAKLTRPRRGERFRRRSMRRFFLILGVVVVVTPATDRALRNLLGALALLGWTRSGLSSLPGWHSQSEVRGTVVLSALPSCEMGKLTSATLATLRSCPYSSHNFVISDARLVDVETMRSESLLHLL